MLLKFPCWGDGCRMPLGLSGQPVYLTSEFLASEGLCLLKKKGRMRELYHTRLCSGLHVHPPTHIHTYTQTQKKEKGFFYLTH